MSDLDLTPATMSVASIMALYALDEAQDAMFCTVEGTAKCRAAGEARNAAYAALTDHVCALENKIAAAAREGDRERERLADVAAGAAVKRLVDHRAYGEECTCADESGWGFSCWYRLSDDERDDVRRTAVHDAVLEALQDFDAARAASAPHTGGG